MQKCLLKLNKTLRYIYNYVDLACLLIKQQSCRNNPNESYTERKAMHEPCGYALSFVCSFDSKENNKIFTEEEIVLKGFVVI